MRLIPLQFLQLYAASQQKPAPAASVIDIERFIFDPDNKISSCRQAVLYAFYRPICTVSHDEASFGA